MLVKGVGYVQGTVNLPEAACTAVFLRDVHHLKAQSPLSQIWKTAFFVVFDGDQPD